MNILLGILLIIFSIIMLIYKYTKNGLMLFFEVPFLTAIIWIISLGFYNLRLSDYYNPNFLLNLIVLIIIINFFMLNSFSKINIISIKKINIDDISKNKEQLFSIMMFFLFGLSILSFILTMKVYGFRIFYDNSVNHQEYVLAYFYNFLPFLCGYFYIKSRNKHKVYLLLVVLSFIMIFLSMNRGLILFTILIIFYYELIRYIKIRIKLNYKIMMMILILLIGFIFIFDNLGNQRLDTVLNEVYHFSENTLYGMSEQIPSWFVKIYIYISSPLENASNVLNYQMSQPSFTFFNQLFYPFIKLMANIIGQSNSYTLWLDSVSNFYPYLSNICGLTVSTFLLDALQDFGIIGIFVYLFFYDFIWLGITKFMNSNTYGITKILVFGIIINVFYWSVFDNSVFAMGNLWVNVTLIMLINLICNRFKYKKIVLVLKDKKY